jgi:hypothetical protein
VLILKCADVPISGGNVEHNSLVMCLWDEEVECRAGAEHGDVFSIY